MSLSDSQPPSGDSAPPPLPGSGPPPLPPEIPGDPAEPVLPDPGVPAEAVEEVPLRGEAADRLKAIHQPEDVPLSHEAADPVTPVQPEPEPAAPVQPAPVTVAVANPPSLPAYRPDITDRLPNASAGKPYDARLPETRGQTAGHVFVESVDLPAQTGLHFDPATLRVHGMPGTAGDYYVRVRLRPASHPSAPASEVVFGLTINPDPRTLWKNKPSDPGLDFAKPDDACSELHAGELHWIGASRRGRSHAHEGKPRDDDYTFSRLDSGWHVAIASDGAGSAKFSRRGSQLACSAATAFLAEKSGQDLTADAAAWLADPVAENHTRLKNALYQQLAGAAFAAHKALNEEAAAHGAAARDFNATFIVVIARQFGSEWVVASFSIGDGGAGVIDSTGTLHILSAPDGGEFAGQTVFITMSNLFRDAAAVMRRIFLKRLPGIRMVALMTDGVTDPKFETDANFENPEKWDALRSDLAATLDPVLSGTSAPDTLLAWLDFWSPGNHDDRTIVLGLPAGQTLHQP